MNKETVVEQGCDEWRSLRATRITASMFKAAMARKTSGIRGTYLEQLKKAIAYGIMPDDSPRPWHFHGMETEPIAAQAYQWRILQDVRTCGMWLHPEDPDIISASPDRIVPAWDAGVEIKSRSSLKKHQDVIDKNCLPSEHMAQVQGQIWVCGFRFIDYVDYYRQRVQDIARDGGRIPDRMWIYRVWPDRDYIGRMSEKVYEFWSEVEKGVKNYGWKR